MISVVTIKLAPAALMIQFYLNHDAARVAADNYSSYEIRPCFAVFDVEGEAAAEEVFDLTNNPSRQLERVQLYGRARSLSVGDIVEVDSVNYLCASTGWVNLELETA